jgi:hypothetical protein
MSILSSLLKLFKAIVSKIFAVFKKLFKVLLPVLIAVAIVYFGAPYLASFFTGIGGPAWLSNALLSLPGYISSGLSYLWDLASPIVGMIKQGFSKAWAWFSDLKIGTQALIALGASYAIAPEETAELVSDIATGIGDLAETVLDAALGGGFGTLLLVAAGIWFFTRDNEQGTLVLREGGSDARLQQS